MDMLIPRLAIVASLLVAGHASAAHLQLSPTSNRGGQLPSGIESIAFSTRDGDWVPDIQLPQKPRQGDRVQLRVDATLPTLLHSGGTNINLPSLQLTQGSALDLTYNAARGLWIASGSQVSSLAPSLTGSALPAEHGRITTYEMADGNWAPTIRLPAKASDGDVVAISSLATYSARISPEHLMFASTLSIDSGDRYAFVYREDFGKWLLKSAPMRETWATNANATLQLAAPLKPRSVIHLADGHWVPQVLLPAKAGDRDRLTILSSATYLSVIGNQHSSTRAPMHLYAGAEYEFIYSGDTARWELISSPGDVRQAGRVPRGMLPPLRTPTTTVHVSDGNRVALLTLPDNSRPDSRVVVDVQSTSGVQVAAGNARHALRSGERVTFVVDGSGKWQRETRTIDLLLLYSDKLRAALGESAARARMLESFRLTNQGLANSGANFRFRIAGLREFTAMPRWTGLHHPLSELGSHPGAQAWRNSAKADGIYYDGTEDGCGLAYVKAGSNNMVATGAIHCGITVMRHELGHNMSLHHGGTKGAGYAQGYLPVSSIMAGNAIPYYATPHRLTQADGIAMGIPQRFDAVRAMNEYSATVEAFR